MGRHSYVGEFSHISQNTHIGNFTSIGNLVTFGAQKHPYNYLTTFPFEEILTKVERLITVIGSDVWVGCNSVVIQGVRVGDGAVIGAGAVVTKDVPPYMMVDDNEELVGSINLVGLRRAGFSEEVKRDIKNAYKLLYLSGLNVTQAIESIARRCHSKEVSGLVQFMKNSKRGILGHRKKKEIFLQHV